MSNPCVQFLDGGYWVAESRVSLDSIIYAFSQGQVPESIAQSFPVLSLAQIYGAIAFYLANRDLIDEYLAKARTDYDVKRRAGRDSDPAFYQKLADAKRQKQPN